MEGEGEVIKRWQDPRKLMVLNIKCWSVWSNYKHSNTFKILVGIMPSLSSTNCMLDWSPTTVVIKNMFLMQHNWHSPGSTKHQEKIDNGNYQATPTVKSLQVGAKMETSY